MNGKVKLQAPAREAPCVALPPRRFPAHLHSSGSSESGRGGERASTWLQRVKQPGGKAGN